MSTDEIHSDTAPLVSVVIISKDERALATSIEALRPQISAHRGRAELIVVDASEGRLDDIRDAAPDVRWIDFIRPFGVAVSIPHQRNAGVRAARGAVIAFCDSGGVPADDWLDALTSPIANGRLHASCGPLRSIGESVYRDLNNIADGEIPALPPTANMAFSRAAFDAVGGFDESFRYGSDVDFSWRLHDAGMPVCQVVGALMFMDWGDRSRQTRRSALYGRAQARLWLKHPRRWKNLPRDAPIVLLYPAWLLALPVALGLVVARRFKPLAAWCALPLALIARNSRNGGAARAVETVRQNAILGAGVLVEVAARQFERQPPVLFYPQDRAQYQSRLAASLDGADCRVGYLAEPTRSMTVNLALLPLTSLRARLGGARVLHIHWLFPFDLVWLRRMPVARRLTRWWLAVWLDVCRRLGLRIVWTAHNLLPHDQIFDDDLEGRRDLIDRTDAIIALGTHAKTQIESIFGARVAAVIPEAATAVGRAPNRADARRSLGVASDTMLVVFVGSLEPYKGLDLLLDAVTEPIHGLTLRIAGSSGHRKHVSTLQARIAELQSRGVDVDIAVKRLTDDEFATRLAAADFAVFPFRRVTNSGSVISALGAGVPIMVPDLGELGELPDEATLRWSYEGGAAALRRSIEHAVGLAAVERDEMRASASAWAATHTWDDTGRATRAVYEAALRNPPKAAA